MHVQYIKAETQKCVKAAMCKLFCAPSCLATTKTSCLWLGPYHCRFSMASGHVAWNQAKFAKLSITLFIAGDLHGDRPECEFTHCLPNFRATVTLLGLQLAEE